MRNFFLLTLLFVNSLNKPAFAEDLINKSKTSTVTDEGYKLGVMDKMANMITNMNSEKSNNTPANQDLPPTTNNNFDTFYSGKHQKIEIPTGTVSSSSGKLGEGKSKNKRELNDAYNNFQNGNIEAALQYYKKAYNIDPKNIDAIFGIATSYQMLGQNDEATKKYMELLEIEPDYYSAKNNLIILISGNSVDKAISELKKIDEKYPNNAFVLAQIGTIYSFLDKNNDAIFFLGKAIEIEPSNPIYSYNMAITLDKIEKYKDAYIYYEHTIDLITPSTLLDKASIFNRMSYIRHKS